MRCFTPFPIHHIFDIHNLTEGWFFDTDPVIFLKRCGSHIIVKIFNHDIFGAALLPKQTGL